MKPKILLWLALVLSGFVFGSASSVRAAESATNAEPRYLDKSLSEWIPLTEEEGSETDLFRRRDARAVPAVLAIGTNALPWLVQWIRSEKPERVQLGITGLDLLGPIAKPAVPELVRLVNAWPSSADWSNAVSALAVLRDADGYPYALPFLLSFTTNAAMPAEIRLEALQAIADAGWHAHPVVWVFSLSLHDKDWRVVAKGAEALGYFCVEPEVAVPALAACLRSHTEVPGNTTGKNDADFAVRNSAAQALLHFSGYLDSQSKNSALVDSAHLTQTREAMRLAVTVMVKALSDKNYRVAKNAADALRDAAVEPELAVAALIKSLDYPQRDVQRSAAVALGAFGAAARSAVPALTKKSQDDPHGYVGFFVDIALKNIVLEAKP